MYKLNLSIILILIGSILASVVSASGQSASVSIVGGFKVCVTQADTLYTLTVNVVIPDNSTCHISSYAIRWGDGSAEEKFTFDANNLAHSHTYRLTPMFEQCIEKQEFDIRLTTIRTGANCSETNNTSTITIFAIPTAQFSVPQGCIGKIVSFKNTTCPESAQNNYSWKYGDGTTGVDAYHTYSQNGSFKVQLEVKNSNCNSSSVANGLVIIKDKPTALFSPMGIVKKSGDTILVCQREKLSLDARNSQNATSFTWQGIYANSDTLNASKTSFLFNTAGVATVKLTVNNACDLPDEALVFVRVLSASAQAKDVGLCASNTTAVRLQASPIGGVWSLTNCNGCTVKQDSVLNISTNRFQAIYTITTLDGCVASSTSIISIVNPKANFEVNAINCLNKTVTITNNSTDVTSYRWYMDNIILTTQATPSPFTASLGNHQITLYTQQLNCVDTITKAIKVIDAPKPISFVNDFSVGCSPLSVAFNAPKPQVDVTYHWDFGNGQTKDDIGNQTQLYENNANNNLIFKATLTAENACGTEKFSKHIIVKPLPKAEIGYDSTASRCSPARILFSNRSNAFNTAIVFWGDGSSTTIKDTLTHVFVNNDTIPKKIKVKIKIVGDCGVSNDSTTVMVYPSKQRALFSIISKAIICVGESIILKDASTPIPISTVWKINGVPFVNGAVLEPTFTQAGIFRLTNLSIGQCGIDSMTHQIEVKPAPKGDFTIPKETCLGALFEVKNISNPNLKFAFEYGSQIDSTHFSQKIRAVESTHTVKLRLTDANNCRAIIEKNIDISPPPKADFVAVLDSTLCHQKVYLTSTSKNTTGFEWIIDETIVGFGANTAALVQAGKHDITLIATSLKGFCADTLKRKNSLDIEDCMLYIPDAFTPNKDLINDDFIITNIEKHPTSFIEIFNRWGVLVFVSTGEDYLKLPFRGTQGGKLLQPGSYAYKITIPNYQGKDLHVLYGAIEILY